MTRLEPNIAIFEGAANTVLWQPRLATRLDHHRKEGSSVLTGLIKTGTGLPMTRPLLHGEEGVS